MKSYDGKVGKARCVVTVNGQTKGENLGGFVVNFAWLFSEDRPIFFPHLRIYRCRARRVKPLSSVLLCTRKPLLFSTFDVIKIRFKSSPIKTLKAVSLVVNGL